MMMVIFGWVAGVEAPKAIMKTNGYGEEEEGGAGGQLLITQITQAEPDIIP
jgi:hypothetical protein